MKFINRNNKLLITIAITILYIISTINLISCNSNYKGVEDNKDPSNPNNVKDLAQKSDNLHNGLNTHSTKENKAIRNLKNFKQSFLKPKLDNKESTKAFPKKGLVIKPKGDMNDAPLPDNTTKDTPLLKLDENSEFSDSDKKLFDNMPIKEGQSPIKMPNFVRKFSRKSSFQADVDDWKINKKLTVKAISYNMGGEPLDKKAANILFANNEKYDVLVVSTQESMGSIAKNLMANLVNINKMFKKWNAFVK